MEIEKNIASVVKEVTVYCHSGNKNWNDIKELIINKNIPFIDDGLLELYYKKGLIEFKKNYYKKYENN